MLIKLSDKLSISPFIVRKLTLIPGCYDNGGTKEASPYMSRVAVHQDDGSIDYVAFDDLGTAEQALTKLMEQINDAINKVIANNEEGHDA